jgi:flagellar biogenesis protein FliO
MFKTQKQKMTPFFLIIIIGLFFIFPLTARSASSDSAKPITNSSIKLPVGEDLENKPIGKAPNESNSGTGLTGAKQPMSYLPQTIVALVLVVGLIFLIAWVLRKGLPIAPRLFGSLPFITILGKTHLSPKQNLTLIKFDNRLILLGITENQINPVLVVDDSEDVSRLTSRIEETRPSSITHGFRGLFKKESEKISESSPNEGQLSDISLTNSTQNEVFHLKNELNLLLNKIEKMKGSGG